jgi:tether containing UBX domain for GLUT4
MSHVVVVNSFAKTTKIPTTPTKDLNTVKNEACQKFGLNQDQYALKWNNKPVNLSNTIRFAGLPQGARLELVQASRSPSVVSVALQLPASDKRDLNDRLVEKFASNTSLWEILRQFESGQGSNFNFTQRAIPEISNGSSGAGRMHYEMPVITVMPDHKVYSSFVDLQKTLSQLGISDSRALLKLSYKNSGTPLEEAMTQISQYFKSAEPTASGAHAATSTQASSIPNLEGAAPEAATTVAGETIRADEPDPEVKDVDEKLEEQQTATGSIPAVDGPKEEKENIPPLSSVPVSSADPTTTQSSQPSAPNTASSRNVQIFAAPTSSTPQAARQNIDDSDFEPTKEQALAQLAAYQRQSRNTRLPSDKELEQQEAKRQEKLNATAERGGSLRVRLPDGAYIQVNLLKTDTATDVYSTVDSCLSIRNEPYDLQYRSRTGQPVKMERNSKRVFQDLGFSNSELVTFLWGEKASDEARRNKNVLSAHHQQQAQPLKVEESLVQQQNGESSSSQGNAEGKKKIASKGDVEAKLKKFLQFGKKR